MARELVILGGGEHARVVIDAALSRPDEWRVLGYVEARPVEQLERRFALPWLGGDDVARASFPAALFVLGVGRIAARERIATLYAERPFACVIHRDASISATATLGPGSLVLARAVVNTGARLGEHVIVNSGAIVEHDVEVGEHVHVGPGGVIGGGAQLGRAVHVGLGACVRDHVRVGAHVTIGMGAAVVANVEDSAVVLGVPARPVR